MAKLQLYINKSLRGYKNIVNINPEEEVSHHIHDYRPALEAIIYDSSHSNVFYLLTYLETGIVMSVLRTIPGNHPADHIAASVFFPEGVQINPKDVFDLGQKVGDAISAEDNELSHATISALRELFNKDYPVDASAPLRLPSSGHIYAYAYFGKGAPSLYDYAEAQFYQPEFAQYAGILLIDGISGAKGRESKEDLTRNPLMPTTVLNPPRTTPEGFVPHIYHRIFDTPLIVPAGIPLEIQWRRGGFEPVCQMVTASKEKPTAISRPDVSKAKKTITPTSFFVTEQGSQRSVGAFLIKVNGIDIDQPHTFTYDELVDAKVEISSPGYFAFSGNLDLASTTQALVQMKQLHRTYRFDLPLNTPDPVEAIRIYLKSKKPITICPIEGYEVTGGKIIEGSGVSNRLVYVGGRSRKLFSMAAIAATVIFLLGFFVGWLAFDVEETETANETPQATEQPAQVPVTQAPSDITERSDKSDNTVTTAADTAEQPTAADIDDAVEYLESNKSWSRDDMEKMPALKGLYDDLNNYNFDRLKTFWNLRLGKSATFATVIRAVEGSAIKRDPRTGKHAPSYINEGNESINWRSYTYWVDP